MSDKKRFLGIDPSYIYIAFTLGAILTYIVDLVLDIILASTYIYDGLIWYGVITLLFTICPTVLVQIFSIRWHQMDEMMNRPMWAIHTALMGVIHRYFTVISLYKEAVESGDEVDYQRFYQQQSDVCMLRLFDSFGESAPQLVFYLYVLIVKSEWSPMQAAWTGISAVASMVSLGWGIAAYSSAMRMIRPDKGKMSWSGMVTQTFWRAGMLTARIVALVMLTYALEKWTLVVMFIHWLLMTIWVIWQETDFCNNIWEERLYNATVGVIYCFAFFNLKEGRSRYRAFVFYTIIIFENLAFLAVFYWIKPIYDPEHSFSYWLITSSFAIVIVSMTIGLVSMLVYYRFFHPAGPIRPCMRQSVDFQEDIDELKRNSEKPQGQSSPDFVVYSTSGDVENRSSPVQNNRARRINYSRSFKTSCPPSKRSRETSHATSHSPEAELAQQMAAISPISTRNYRERAIDCGGSMSPIITQPLQDRVDSAYGTDSNRTGSPPQKVNESPNSSQNSNSTAFSNDAYMASEEAAQIINQADKSDDNTYMSVHVQQKTEQNMVLKRSPVVRDVTSGFAQISSTSQLMRRKMTILVPNSLEKTISLEALNPSKSGQSFANMSNHDYENMALININREAFKPGQPSQVSHWRTYSNMADGNHDESCAYDRMKYYDIYPLSKEMKEQLYRSLTPLSTAATMASSDSVASTTDTYEPIENFDNSGSAVVTLIHHDGDKISTRQITSMQSLQEVLSKHEKIPMDDPQDRPDLYILAPMRLLSPIIEESACNNTASDYNSLNKSLMTVISEIVNKTGPTYAAPVAAAQVAHVGADGRFAESIESTSSLVHTIEEIRNNSLCNLYYTTANETKPVKTSNCKAAPQVPPRNEPKFAKIAEEPDAESLKSPKFAEIQERRKKSALYTSVGSRKNLFELAGTTNHILNTPVKACSEPLSLVLDPSQQSENFDPSTLRPFMNSHSLSPSAKYGNDDNTPPLKANQFVRNTNAYRPRRKFSILRDRFDNPVPLPISQTTVQKNRMILAKSKNDLYENISDDFLSLRNNSMKAKAERLAKCKSVPTFVSIDSQDLLLKADEQYNKDGFMSRRNQWSTASYQLRPGLPSRQSNARRSMSILDDKENFCPIQSDEPPRRPPRPIIRPKVKLNSPRKDPMTYRLSSGASLSPNARIFTTHQRAPR